MTNANNRPDLTLLARIAKTLKAHKAQKITPITGSAPWHASLTGKLTWTTIGQMSQATAERGRLADVRRDHVLSLIGAN